jgi:mono/diheme cytochrome c family protein
MAPGYEFASTVQHSAMPPMGTILTLDERRDLVAYLSSHRD